MGVMEREDEGESKRGEGRISGWRVEGKSWGTERGTKVAKKEMLSVEIQGGQGKKTVDRWWGRPTEGEILKGLKYKRINCIEM